jgi:hypothetical protein
MDTQKNNLNENEGQEKKEKGMDSSTLGMTAAGLTAAGVVGSQLLNNEEDTSTSEEEPTSDTVTTTTTSTTGGGNQSQYEGPDDDILEIPVEPNQGQTANVDELTPIAPDRPGTPDDQLANNTPTDVVIGDADISDPNEEELVAIAEQIVNDPVEDLPDVAANEINMDDILYAENGDELALNDHNSDEVISGEIEDLDDTETDIFTQVEETSIEDETAMEVFETPEDIFDDGDVIDDILPDISCDLTEEG